jgi:hypothetical protein
MKINAEAFILARRIRESCIRGGNIRELMQSWKGLWLSWENHPKKDFTQFCKLQLGLCFLACGEPDTLLLDPVDGWKRIPTSSLLSDLVDEWKRIPTSSPFPKVLGARELGMWLALSNEIKLLAKYWNQIPLSPYREAFAHGARDGFNEAGNVTGLLGMGVELGEHGLEELLMKLDN